MRISVVLPVYNEAKWMHIALDSLVDQSVPFELIVVDNESTDDSAQVARRYTPLVFTAPRGKLNALQLGVIEAGGDIIVTVDADCHYPNDYIEKISTHFTDPNVALVLGVLRDYNDTHVNATRATFEGLGFFLFKVGAAGVRAFRRDAFLTVGGFNLKTYQFDLTNMVLEEQIRLHLKLSQVGRPVFDPSLVVWHMPRRGLCSQCPNQGEETLCQYCREAELGQRF